MILHSGLHLLTLSAQNKQTVSVRGKKAIPLSWEVKDPAMEIR